MEATHAKEKMLMWNPVPSGDAVSIVDVFFNGFFVSDQAWLVWRRSPYIKAIGNPINVDNCRACLGSFEGVPREYERL